MVLYTIPFHSGHSQLCSVHVARVVAVALVVVEEETQKMADIQVILVDGSAGQDQVDGKVGPGL